MFDDSWVKKKLNACEQLPCFKWFLNVYKLQNRQGGGHRRSSTFEFRFKKY